MNRSSHIERHQHYPKDWGRLVTVSQGEWLDHFRYRVQVISGMWSDKATFLHFLKAELPNAISKVLTPRHTAHLKFYIVFPLKKDKHGPPFTEISFSLPMPEHYRIKPKPVKLQRCLLDEPFDFGFGVT